MEILYELTIDNVIEQMIEIADLLRLKSNHDETQDDLFEMGERLGQLAEWLVETYGDN